MGSSGCAFVCYDDLILCASLVFMNFVYLKGTNEISSMGRLNAHINTVGSLALNYNCQWVDFVFQRSFCQSALKKMNISEK